VSTVLVTGGRGYIGRYVIDELDRLGHTAVDYSRDVAPAPRNARHVPVLGELSDVPRLLVTLQRHGVDHIVHTAGQSHPDVSLEMPLATVEANVMGACSVLEAARLAGVRRIVLFSSECAYGHTPPGTVPESAPLQPRTPYGVTKAATEMLGRSYNECFGLDTIALRVAQVYGPGQVMPETVRDAIKTLLRGEAVRLEHGRDQRLQLVHVTDVARAVIAACFAGDHRLHAYNVTGGVLPTLGEVLERLAALIPGATLDVGPGEMGGDRQGLFEIEAARHDLGYEPEVSLDRGLADYVEWLRHHDY
jgi:UDP-glucose 4-epimerase